MLQGVKDEGRDQESEYVENLTAPKIALLFLSVGELHNEPVWRAFFEIAGA